MRCLQSVSLNRRNRLSGRLQQGSSIAEIPVALWLLLVVMTFPLLILATVTLRSTFLSLAAKDAAHAASKAKTFEVGTAEAPSAVELAQTQATAAAAAIPGVTISDISTKILIANIDSENVTSQSTKLDAPADTSENIYSVEVVVTGEVEPLMRYNLPLFGEIPGLTSAVSMSCAGREMFESTQGLTE